MVKTDANGNELAANSWRRYPDVRGCQIDAFTDRRFMRIAGTVINFDPAIFSAPTDLFLLQVDEQGNELDFDMYPIAQGNKVPGRLEPPMAVSTSLYPGVFNLASNPVFSLDAAGNLLWEKFPF